LDYYRNHINTNKNKKTNNYLMLQQVGQQVKYLTNYFLFFLRYLTSNTKKYLLIKIFKKKTKQKKKCYIQKNGSPNGLLQVFGKGQPIFIFYRMTNNINNTKIPKKGWPKLWGLLL